MKKLIFIFCLFLSIGASAQRIYRVEGQPQRFVNALGIPVMPASYYNNSSDTALIFLDRNDTTTISFKFKGLVKKLGGSRLPWDSLTGVPSNFSTTYGLSNDIQDSILTRLPYENATRSLNMGNYRVSARGLLGDTLFARTSAGGFLATNSGSVIASFGAGGSNEIDFHGFAGQDYNRSGSFTDLSFVTKIWADSNLNLKANKTDSTDLLSKTVRTFGAQTGITGDKSFTNNISANSFIKSSGTNDQILLGDGSVQSKALIHNGAPSFDTTSRTLNIPILNGGFYSVVIPRGTTSGAEGITALSSSRLGNLITIAGDNGSTTTISVRDADSASIVKFTDSSTIIADRWLPNRSEDSTKVLRSLINTKGVGTVTSVGVLAGTGISISGSPITSSGTINITNTAPDQTVTLTAGTGISVSGTYPNFTVINTSPSSGGTVTGVTASAPLSSSGGTSPNITISQATTSTNGYLSSTDWNTFNNKVSYTDALARGALSGGTGISYNTTTGVITNNAPDQTVTLTAGTNIGITGSYPNFTINNTSSATGTVTSVGLSAPTGFSVSGSPVTSTGTLALGFATGYSLPTDANQTNWTTAFNKRLSSASLTSSQLTLTLADASTVTASVPTFNQNTTGTAASLSAVLSSTLGGAGAVNGILKANGSGTVSAAVAGTDYVAPSALSGYLPLSGGTLTGALNGTSLSMSGGGVFGTNILIGAGGASSNYRLTLNGDAATVAGGAVFRANGTDVMYFGNIAAANTTDWEIWNPRNGYIRIGVNNAEAARFASDGTFLINTTTTDGTNKLIVNGGVKFGTGGTTTITAAGSATFSSSVYAQGYRFAYAAKSSNYTLTDNDDYITVTNASTITLPTAVGRSGKRYVIRSTAGSGVASSLATTSFQTIDGIIGPFSFGWGNYNIIIVFSDGSNWLSETFITGG